MKQETNNVVTLSGIRVDLTDVQSCQIINGVYYVHLENGMKMQITEAEGEVLNTFLHDPRSLRANNLFSLLIEVSKNVRPRSNMSDPNPVEGGFYVAPDLPAGMVKTPPPIKKEFTTSWTRETVFADLDRMPMMQAKFFDQMPANRQGPSTAMLPTDIPYSELMAFGGYRTKVTIEVIPW